MSYTNVEARQQMLDDLARAAEQLARAVASLSAAYEQLDEQQGDALEARLFRPVQHAFGRAQRTQSAQQASGGRWIRRAGIAQQPDAGIQQLLHLHRVIELIEILLIGRIQRVLDGLLLLMAQDYLSVAFHAYALYCIYRGLAAAQAAAQA